jgi:hypothetical protein
MSSRSMAARRFSFLLNPGGIVIGYILTLFAVVAGVGAFPSSKFWMGLLFVVVGVFLVVAVLVLVLVYLFCICVVFAALRRLVRQLLFGIERWQMERQSSSQQNDLESQEINAGLWDRWIDGHCELLDRSHNGKEWWSDGSSYF